MYKTVTKGPEFSQNVPKRDQNLYILGLAHLGFERTGGETEASWETGRGQDEAPSYWPDGREQAIAPERGRGLAAAVDYSRTRERKVTNVASRENEVTWDVMQVFVPVRCLVAAGRCVCSNGWVSSAVGTGLWAAGWDERSTASSPLHQQGAAEAPLKITMHTSDFSTYSQEMEICIKTYKVYY